MPLREIKDKKLAHAVRRVAKATLPTSVGANDTIRLFACIDNYDDLIFVDYDAVNYQ